MKKPTRINQKLRIVIFILLASQISQAQVTSTSTNFRRNIATIMFAGLGGAVLGLSTLSFYGEPQEHIGNIWLGLGLGAAAGSAYVIRESTRDLAEGETESSTTERRFFAQASIPSAKNISIHKGSRSEASVPLFQWQWIF